MHNKTMSRSLGVHRKQQQKKLGRGKNSPWDHKRLSWWGGHETMRGCFGGTGGKKCTWNEMKGSLGWVVGMKNSPEDHKFNSLWDRGEKFKETMRGSLGGERVKNSPWDPKRLTRWAGQVNLTLHTWVNNADIFSTAPYYSVIARQAGEQLRWILLQWWRWGVKLLNLNLIMEEQFYIQLRQ